jgi:hypothetical protein
VNEEPLEPPDAPELPEDPLPPDWSLFETEPHPSDAAASEAARNQRGGGSTPESSRTDLRCVNPSVAIASDVHRHTRAPSRATATRGENHRIVSTSKAAVLRDWFP